MVLSTTLSLLSGVVSVLAELDFEQQPFYHLTVRATDGGSPRLSNQASAFRDLRSFSLCFRRFVY